MTDFNKENIEVFKKNFVNQTILPEDSTMSNFRIYDCLNWIQVMHGLRMFDQSSIKKLYESRYSHYRPSDVEYLSTLEHTPSPGWISCRQAVNMVKKLSNTAMEYKL